MSRASGLFHAVECLAHGAIADGMHMNQQATGIGGIDQFTEVLRVQQQFTALAGVL